MGMVIGARIAGCQNTTFQKPVVHDCNHTCNYKFATGDLHGQQLNEWKTSHQLRAQRKALVFIYVTLAF